MDRHRMADEHETFLAARFGGRKSRGSGSQWRDQMDGRNDTVREDLAFAWDGKSTLAKSITITRDMWAKAHEQADGDIPMLGLRFYDTEVLDVGLDLVTVEADVLAELREEVLRLRRELAISETVASKTKEHYIRRTERLTARAEQMPDADSVVRLLGEMGLPESQRIALMYTMVPKTVVRVLGDKTVASRNGVEIPVISVNVEASVDGPTRIYVNGEQIAHGEVWVNGDLYCAVPQYPLDPELASEPETAG